MPRINQDNKLIIFVLSTGRCGTKSVAKYFGLRHEPDGREPNIEALKKRIRRTPKSYYGETSGFWSLQVDLLKQHFPNALYFHLIRDGRRVIPSLINNYTYAYRPQDIPERNLELPVSNWNELNQFEKCCWYWRYINEFLDKRIKNKIFLEDMLFLPRLNTKNECNICPPYELWTKEQKETFDKICGELQRKYGYE